MPPSSTFNNLPSDKHQRILDEALSEFAAKGYSRASLNRLEVSLLAGLEMIAANPRLFQLYLRVMFEGDVPFRDRLLASIRLFSHDYIMDLLTGGVADGKLRPDLDLEMAALVVDATLECFLIASVMEHMDTGLGLEDADAARAAQLAAGQVDTLRRGLGAES